MDKTLAEILKESGLGKTESNVTKLDTSKVNVPSGSTLNGLLVTKPDGTTVYIPINNDGSFTSTDTFPAGTNFKPISAASGETISVVTVNGNKIPVAKNGTPTWADVKDAAQKNGIDLSKPVPAGYTFTGDYKKSGNTVNDGDAVTASDTITPVFTKPAAFTVGGKPVNLGDITYPDTGKKLSDILSGAGLTNNTPDSKDIPTGQKFDHWKVTLPDGTEKHISATAAATTDIPAGATIAPVFIDLSKKSITFKLQNAKSDSLGDVTITVDSTVSAQTWAEIKTAGGTKITSPKAPAGYTFVKWQQSGSDVADGTSYSENAIFTAVFEKTLSYTFNYGAGDKPVSYKVTYPATTNSKTLKDIFNSIYSQNQTEIKALIKANYSNIEEAKIDQSAFENGKTFAPQVGKAFAGWTVTYAGSSKIVKASEISGAGDFLSGTSVTANWTTITRIALPGGESIDTTKFEGGYMDAVAIDDFYVGNTEITRGQWKAVMHDGTKWIHKDGETQWTRANNTADSGNMNMPMNQISWYDAIIYCNRLSTLQGRTPYYYFEYNGETYKGDAFISKLDEIYNPTYGNNARNQTTVNLWASIKIKHDEDTKKPGYRLLTADYWRYAAHGGNENPYPVYSGTTSTTVGYNTEGLNSVAWYKATGGMHEVGMKGGDSPMRDMTGNVSEWCEDEYANYTRLYIGGAYDTDSQYVASLKIDAVKSPTGDAKAAMLNPKNTNYPTSSALTGNNANYAAGSTGDRGSQGMRIMVPIAK